MATNRVDPETATLVGSVPNEEMGEPGMVVRLPSRLTRNAATESEPPLTAKSVELPASRTRLRSEALFPKANDGPAPIPPVGKVPSKVSTPSAPRGVSQDGVADRRVGDVGHHVDDVRRGLGLGRRRRDAARATASPAAIECIMRRGGVRSVRSSCGIG